MSSKEVYISVINKLTKEGYIFPKVCIEYLSDTKNVDELIDPGCPEHIHAATTNFSWDYNVDKVYHGEYKDCYYKRYFKDGKIITHYFNKPEEIIETCIPKPEKCNLSEVPEKLLEGAETHASKKYENYLITFNKGDLYSWRFMDENQGCCCWYVIYGDSDEIPMVYRSDVYEDEVLHKLYDWNEFVKKRLKHNSNI